MYNRRLIRLVVLATMFVAGLVLAYAVGLFEDVNQSGAAAKSADVFLGEKEKLSRLHPPHSFHICAGVYQSLLSKEGNTGAPYAIYLFKMPAENFSEKYTATSAGHTDEGTVRRHGRKLAFSGMGEAAIAADRSHCYIIFDEAIYRKKK
jgi:hypothetical protein